MKIKHFVLLTMCSLFCFSGCFFNKEQPQNSGETSSTESTSQEEIVVPTTPMITVNQSTVTFCVGETFTLIAAADNIENPIFSWAIDGDAAADVVSVAQNGNTATITALKVGETKLIASIEHDGHVYFKSVIVTVQEDSDVALVLSDNIGFDKNGYHVRLSTISTENGDTTSIVPVVTAYKNNKIVAMDNFTWSSDDAGVVAINDNTFTSVSEGETSIDGSCVIDDVHYSVKISVEVYRPKIALDEDFVVEVENLSPLNISSQIKGITRDVVYNGESVGTFDGQSGVITLWKESLPQTASQMGEDRTLSIETSLASYLINVDLYTKIIHTKEDFEGMAALAKNAAWYDAALWDGYFVLGDDIIYNGMFQSKIADIESLWAAGGGSWYNGGLYGFKGVFDGKGHTIEGISIDNGSNMGSVFGVLHIDGVIKNVSFMKSSVAANSSLVCCAGGGSIENVYIQYVSIGKGSQHYEGDGSVNNYCGSFFSFKEPTATANVSNCVIDVSRASFNPKTAVKIVGSEYVSIKNVFVIGGTKAQQSASNATLAFSSVIDFVNDANAQSRYKKFDSDFWSMENGVPVSKTVYAEVCNQDVAFTEKIDYLAAGTSYQFSLNNDYAMLTCNSEYVVINGSEISVSQDAVHGEEVVITATSIFDETKSDTFTCTLSVIDWANCVDLTAEKNTAFYDITEKKVYFAELSAKVPDEVLYFINPDATKATFADDGDEAKEIIAVTKDAFYKFNCQSVTKVIATAADLQYMRKDYTVSSYGNQGCYDGVITGTFVLINDIDCSGLELPNTGRYWENSRGFGSTFDGRGYTISNLSIGENGLFGVLSYATIKNVNFTNVKLKTADQGAYVSLFASRAFNSLIENVSMQFVEYIAGDSVYHCSGLMVYETTFDCLFKDVTIDISQVSGVSYLTECFYGADIPYRSENKSEYANITVIVADENAIPVFAYNDAKGTVEDIVEYPDGFTFQDASGNVLE